MKYVCKETGQVYEIENSSYNGTFLNVNGTTITDIELQDKSFSSPLIHKGDYSVFVNGDEIIFHNFDNAYRFAMENQKDSFYL